MKIFEIVFMHGGTTIVFGKTRTQLRRKYASLRIAEINLIVIS